MKHFTKEEQKKYTESIRKVFTLPEEYLRRADEKLPSDSKELKKDYLKLRSENTLLGERCNQLLTDKGKLIDKVNELEAQIEKMKKYGKLLQDICDVMGNDPYMVWRGLEQRVLILWDKSEEEKGLKMAKNILDRLLKIKPQDWVEIEKWEIKEK